MTGRLTASLGLTLLLGLFACASYAGPAQALPSGFSEENVADVPLPTALDFTPDGRMLVTSKPGQVYAYEDGQRRRILDLGPETCDNSERGLLGVAVGPRFGAADRSFVYLYYTRKTNGECSTAPGPPANPVNRVSRFEMRDDGTIAKGTEDDLLNNIMSTKGNHNGGICTSAGTGTSTSASVMGAATTPSRPDASTRTTPRATSTSSTARSCA